MKNQFLLLLTAILFTISFSCKKPKDGINGTNGYNSLINTSIEATGSNCTSGGLKVETGIDSNRNGILDAGEVNKVSYVCNNSPKIFAARISQAGTNAPAATIINNSLNVSITWSRTAQGHFKGVLNQNLDLSKSVLLSNSMGVLCKFQSNNEISLDNSCGVNAYCDDFAGLELEIRVY